MIDIDDTLVNNFKISDIYKDDYIKVYPIYNEDFKFFRNTVLFLTNRLFKFFENDLNLRKFLIYFRRFIKISNSLPIPLSVCATLTVNNSDINLNKISKNIKVAYPCLLYTSPSPRD